MLKRFYQYWLNVYAVKRDPIAYARNIGVRVGTDCRFIGLTPGQFGSEPYLITIGNHVTLTAGVRFITHDGGVWVLRDKYPEIDVVGSIEIGDNSFIGMGATLMPNIRIGANSVVAAGSVVTKDVPPNMVVAGIPAKAVRTLDEYEKRSLEIALHIRNQPPSLKRKQFIAHAQWRRSTKP